MEVAYILGVLAVVCPRLALVLVLERRAARSLSRQPRGSIVAEKVIGSGRAGPGVGRGTARDKRSTGAGVPCAAWCMPDNAVGVMARGWPARETATTRRLFGTCGREPHAGPRCRAVCEMIILRTY